MKTQLYKLEDRIIGGDIEALKKVAVFLDDTTFVQEFLGYHNYPNTARSVATRILEENCLFTADEFKFDSTISTSKFLTLVNTNKVVFDDLTGMFLITNLTKRKISYDLKIISDFDIKRLDTIAGKSAFPDWYYENQIDGFLYNKNPEALKWIASAWYKKRTRFNRYYFNDDEFLGLIKKLTHLDLGVANENGKITFLYKDDYYAQARLNYLTYWANHYVDYKWNEKKMFFENTKDVAKEKSKEEILFGLLNSDDDSLASDAFQQLTESDTASVKKLAKEYEKNRIDASYILPTFPYRFLNQIVKLTSYCRVTNTSYKPKGWVLDSLNRLNTNLLFKERYRLENFFVDNLNINDITAVEYFGLIHEKGWELTYSIGRILDKIYSRKWHELMDNYKQLELFLKKATLFDGIGIIGNCNKYLRKFEGSGEKIIPVLKQVLLSTNDMEIKKSAEKALVTSSLNKSTMWGFDKPKTKQTTNGVTNLNEKYGAIAKSNKKEDDKRWAIQELFARINYEQLDEALKILIKDTILAGYRQFWIIENDFGLDIGNLDSSSVRNFLRLYNDRSKQQLYEYYFKEKGISCLDISGNLILNKVYEVLKYDVVDAFVGGGGGRREEGVYPLIKLLEIKFKTTLGFPEKFCESEGVYSCNCIDRAKAWMNFLEEKKLVQPDTNEPVSISFNN